MLTRLHLKNYQQEEQPQMFQKMKRPFRSTQKIKDKSPKCRKLYDFFKIKILQWMMRAILLQAIAHQLAMTFIMCLKDVNLKMDSDLKQSRSMNRNCLFQFAFVLKIQAKFNIHQSKQAINAETYIKILRQTLIPLLIENYKNNQGCIFWPDEAQAHYAKSVLEFLKKKKVKFVTYSQNPSKLPETRPIENFWGNLKCLAYANSWKAKDLIELEARIKQCVSKMNTNQYLKQIKILPSKLNKITKYGL